MKKLSVSLIILLAAGAAIAQPVTSVHENFDVPCVSTMHPYGWLMFNPISSTIPQGQWQCNSDLGKDGTPGMYSTGYYSGANHLDTAYIILPQLDLSSYTHAYLRFDSKVSKLHPGDQMHILVSRDTAPEPVGSSYSDITDAAHMTPLFTNADSSNWVTHEVDLTPFVHSGPIYFAFRYTSTTSYANTWYLDNVNTSAVSLKVTTINKNIIPLSLVNCTHTNVTVSYNIGASGPYQLAIYDMEGRTVYSNDLLLQNNTGIYTIDGLSLHTGMYFLKMGNGNCYGVVKLLVN